VAANQISPRCIGPVRPVLGGAPVGDLADRLLVVGEGGVLPGVVVMLGAEADQVAVQRLTQQF
jgi:hypothetical protein